MCIFLLKMWWRPLVEDNNYEIHLRSTEIRNIQTHEHPEYGIGPHPQMIVILSNEPTFYKTIIESQFEAYPNMVANMLIQRELRETLTAPNAGYESHIHHWVDLVANNNYQFNLKTMRVRHRNTHAIPPVVPHNGQYCIVLDNNFLWYAEMFRQQFIAYPHILYEEETDRLINNLVEERADKLQNLAGNYLFRISTEDEH